MLSIVAAMVGIETAGLFTTTHTSSPILDKSDWLRLSNDRRGWRRALLSRVTNIRCTGVVVGVGGVVITNWQTAIIETCWLFEWSL